MSVVYKNLEETDEIFNEIKCIVEDEKLGNKIEIVRMFSAAQREYQDNKLKDKFEERVGKKYIKDVIVFDEKSAIVSFQKTDNLEQGLWYQPVILSNNQNIIFETLDQALIGMVCLKTDNIQAVMWIFKMLGIDTN